MPNIETEREFNLREGERKKRIKETAKIMRKVKKSLIDQGLTTKSAKVHPGWDVHCFFPLVTNPKRIIHFQLYMWPPPEHIINIRVREMDRDEMIKARELSSIGSEENAVRKVMLEKSHIVYNHDAIAILAETSMLSAIGRIIPKTQANLT